MTVRSGGTEGDAGDGPLGGGTNCTVDKIWMNGINFEIFLKLHNYVTDLKLSIFRVLQQFAICIVTTAQQYKGNAIVVSVRDLPSICFGLQWPYL
jgi:hypothetical protein